jgi:hypothetical protein
MNKIWLLTAGALLLVFTCASAEIYRCVTPDGKQVMTDQQAQLPDNCQNIGKSVEASSFNIMPANKGVDAETRPVKPAQGAESKAPMFASLQVQAKALVQNYKEAVAKRYGSGLNVKRRHAIKEVEGLRQQKVEMLDGLTRSGLTNDQQKKIQDILDEIPQQ